MVYIWIIPFFVEKMGPYGSMTRTSGPLRTIATQGSSKVVLRGICLPAEVRRNEPFF
jgi:hypothetical protein